MRPNKNVCFPSDWLMVFLPPGHAQSPLLPEALWKLESTTSCFHSNTLVWPLISLCLLRLLMSYQPIYTSAWVCVSTRSCLILSNPMDCSPPGPSVHGLFQARILECIVISYSRKSSRLRDWTCVANVSCIGKQILYHWVTWEAPFILLPSFICKYLGKVWAWSMVSGLSKCPMEAERQWLMDGRWVCLPRLQTKCHRLDSLTNMNLRHSLEAGCPRSRGWLILFLVKILFLLVDDCLLAHGGERDSSGLFSSYKDSDLMDQDPPLWLHWKKC